MELTGLEKLGADAQFLWLHQNQEPHTPPPRILHGASSEVFVVVVCTHFLGLTQEEAKNCIRIETKKRYFIVTKTKVEHRCTTNRMSEKYEGNALSISSLPSAS